MGLFSVPGTGHVRAAVVSQQAPHDAARDAATQRLARLVYQQRAIVGPGRESWDSALGAWSPGAAIAMGMARAAVVVYESRLRAEQQAEESGDDRA